MSEWGSIVTALEAIVRAADGTIPSGADGFEQGIGSPQALGAHQFPHCYAHDPTEATTEIDWRIREVRLSLQLSIFSKGETQEQVNTRLDAIASGIAANPTLGGIVDFTFPVTRSAIEAQFVGKDLRAGVLIVQTRRTTGNVIGFTVRLDATVAPGSTANDVYTQVVTAVDAIAGSHVSSDYARTVALPTGTDDFQVRVDALERAYDSNDAYTVVQIEVSVLRDVGYAEASGELDALRTLEASLTDPDLYRDLAAVRDVLVRPQTVETMERAAGARG